MQFMQLRKIEDTILSTFLTTPEFVGFNCEPFELEEKYFTDKFNKILARRLAKAVEQKESMSLLEEKLIDWTENVKPQYQGRFLDILQCLPIPMTVAKKYYEEIKIEYFERIARNGR